MSIENDIYVGSCIERYLDGPEQPLFRSLLDKVCKWFAFEIGELLQGRECCEAEGSDTC